MKKILIKGKKEENNDIRIEALFFYEAVIFS